MLPVREDLRRDYPIAFRLEWMQRMLDASFRQLERGTADLPRPGSATTGREVRQAAPAVVYGRPKDAQVTLAAIRRPCSRQRAPLPRPEAAHDAR